MKRGLLMVGLLTLLLGSAGRAKAVPINVYLLSTGNSVNDAAAESVLTAHGDTVTVSSQPYYDFTGPVPAGYNAVVLLQNDTGSGANIPTGGQTALVNYINGGGGLVTGEWTMWGIGTLGYNQTLQPALPVVPTRGYNHNNPISYTQATPNAVLDNGVPSSFTFNADDNGGTETYFQPKTGATVYFGSDFGYGGDGVIGWTYGSGRVISFSTLAGPTELSDPNYGQLFSNAVDFAAEPNNSAAPEPSTLTLFGAAAMTGLGYFGWRRRKQAIVAG